MRWAEGFIAVDWGTTNRRAWRVGPSGTVSEEFDDDKGVLSVEREAFPLAVTEIRGRLGDLPLLMAGMVGSNRGWVEAPYVPCPAGIDDLVERLCWPERDRAAIVPGLSFTRDGEGDVMRGEEVQILGAITADMIPPDGIVCHPGTHNKWVRVEGGKVTRFRTVMTGEIFNLLREHSILSDLLTDEMAVDDAFREGVARGLEGGLLTAELFSVRASVLLGQRRKEDATDYTSGLLIGADVHSALVTAPDGPICVMGRPELTRLYAAALDITGRRSNEIDGEKAFLAGAQAIAERI
jgi:2-dehydro-3-deoxygalactonokinase